MDVQTFVEQSMEGQKAQTETHSATWNFGKEEEWSLDQDEGVIRFTFADGTVAEASAQIVGTLNPEDGTFLWGWDHPSVEDPLQAHAKLSREFGLKNKLQEYTAQKVTCSESDAWRFTAVTARLAGANGSYRGDAGGALVFMTFGEISLTKEHSG